MTETSRRFLLRERTAAAHRRVDEKIGDFDCAQSYGRYLIGLFGFRQPLELTLSRIEWPDALRGWRPTFVSPAIRADLASLGLPQPVAEMARYNHLATKSALFGCLYVLEGSTFGAKLLLKRALALGLSDSCGASHLTAQASSGAWTDFLPVLESTPDFDMDVATSAAIETFSAAETAFAELDHG